MNRKFLLPFFISVIFTFFGINQAEATHLVGGNITSNCNGQDSILLRLSLYRDCSVGSATLGSSQTVTVASSCGTNSVTLSLLPGSGNDITPLCPNWPSPCNGQITQLPLGIEEYLYEGWWVVPTGSACTNWTVSFSLCCRNGDITTGQANQGFYISSNLNTGQTPCNNSPQFLNVPVPYICVGQPFNYNHGVSDPDGDSLRFSILPCKISSSGNTSYTPPLTAQQPLHTTGPLLINPATGTISFTPAFAQVGVLCVLVEEYRNGVKIGEVMRDIQIIVTSCNNQPPLASGINNSTKYDTAVCPGQYVEFDIFSSDPTPFQSVTMNWNQGIPQADTFIISTGQYPTGTFKWTPTVNDIGFHFFTVAVQDDGCPITSTNIFAYVVEVRNPNIDLGPDLTVCNGDTVTIVSTSSVDFNQFTWKPTTGIVDTNVADASFTPTVTTTYTLDATNGFCSASDIITVHVETKPNLTMPADEIICEGESTTLTATGNADSYYWNNSDTTASTTVSPLVTSTYYLTATSTNGCEAIGSVVLTVIQPPLIDAGLDKIICEGDSTLLTAIGTGAEYSWTPLGFVNSPNSANTWAHPTTSTDFIVTNTDVNNCVNADTVHIDVEPAPPINAHSSATIDLGEVVTISSGNPNGTSYLWTPNVGLVNSSVQTDSVIDVSPSQTTIYWVTVTDANGCKSRDSVIIILEAGIIEIPNAFTPNQDGRNDKLELLYTGLVEIEFFRVYNRWGEIIFETTDPTVGWDGTYKNEEQPAGVFTYLIKGIDPTTKLSYMKSGNVTLIK